MTSVRRQHVADGRLRINRAVALAASLVVSALLTAVVLRAPQYHWLAWISFLPLFVVVRLRCPSSAALSGAFWGACLHLFYTAGSTPVTTGLAPAIGAAAPAFGPSAWSLALFIVIPAVYVGLAALPARSAATGVSAAPIGGTTHKRHCSLSSGPRPARPTVFSLLVLALGWTLVEAVLHLHNLFGPHDGLLTGSQEGDGPQFHWLARLLAYVSAAFVVAFGNASLLAAVGNARLSIPLQSSFTRLPHTGAGLASQTLLFVQLWALRQAYPRAPPIQGPGTA